MHFSGLILSPDGQAAFDIAVEGNVGDAESLGRRAGEAVRDKAGTRFFESWT